MKEKNLLKERKEKEIMAVDVVILPPQKIRKHAIF